MNHQTRIFFRTFAGEMLGKIILNWAAAHEQDWASLKYWDQATADAWQQRWTAMAASAMLVTTDILVDQKTIGKP